MSLLSQFLPKKETGEYFLTLGVEEYRILAAVAFISGTDVEVKGIGESDFSDSGNETEAVDIAISTAEKNLSEGTLVEKVVFALPLSFLEGDTVKSEYLERLKKISKELSLVPQGFIEYPAALSFYFEKEEGSPPTALILAIEKNSLTLSLIRVGKVYQNVIVARTSSFLTHFEEAISQFTIDILPSRIIMYDHSEKLEVFREELLKFAWHKHTSFLHTPKIEILSRSTLLTSLVEAAGTSLLKKLEIPVTSPVEKKEETSDREPPQENVAPVHPEMFGFVKEKGIHHHVKKIEREEKIHAHTEEVPANKELLPIQKSSFFSFPSFSFPFFPSFLSRSIPFIVFLVIIVSFFSYFFLTYPKAHIALMTYPLITRENIAVTFTTDTKQAGVGKNVILATLLSHELSGEKTASTTGKAKVGERAKGDVTIYNKTLTTKTFPKGTTLQNGDTRFTLDNDATVASASDTGEGLTFGKVNIPITATTIGPEANLGGGSIFTFKDFPESAYIAKNMQGLTGGTSREVPSVSLEDQKQLESNLIQELVSRGKQELSQKLSAGERLIDSSFTQITVNKKWSKEVGSEATSVSLSLTLKMTVLSYKQDDLISLGKTTNTQTPSDFSQDVQRTYIKVVDITEGKQGILQASAEVSSYFIPTIDTKSIVSHIKGRRYEEAILYLQTIKQIGGVKIFAETSLPFWKNRLPLSENNIEANVATY